MKKSAGKGDIKDRFRVKAGRSFFYEKEHFMSFLWIFTKFIELFLWIFTKKLYIYLWIFTKGGQNVL